jgi:hypothetical protein
VYKWLELRAASHDGEAHAALASSELKLTSAELAEAKRLAQEWRQERSGAER